MSRRARQFAPAREAKHAAAWTPPVVHDFDDEPDDATPCPRCCGEGMDPARDHVITCPACSGED